MTSLSGNAKIDDLIVGNITGEYIDESSDETSENIQHRTITGEVKIDTLVVGYATLEYDDYITSNGGGTRTIDISGDVEIDSYKVGNSSGSLIDNYGVVTAGTSHFSLISYPTEVNVNAGSSFTISVTVKNDGGVDGVVMIRIRDHNNSIVASKQVTVAAGGNQSLTLTATAPSSPGTYSWKVEAYNVDSGAVDDSESFTVEVSGGLFGGIDIQQMMQLFLQLLPFIMLILIISVLVAAIR